MEGSKQQSNIQGGTLLDVPLFMAAVHEMKSPLALVRQLGLELEAGDSSNDEVAEIARQIVLTSERALRLTTSLSKASRLEDGLFDVEPINPMSVCEEVVQELKPLYKAKGRDIRLVKRNRAMLGVANKDLLRRILLSFADNALYYGGEDAPVVITTKTYESGRRIRLGVRDYGPSVPSHVWSKLVGSLGSRQQPLHSRPDSSGLGIFVAKQFAEAMHAEVGATRHRDGATFYVDIYASTQLRLL